MDLSPYVENLRIELVVAADAGGDEARALAERLTSPLEAAARLTLLSALSDAADEITRELAPGSVDLRLRGLNPEFVVNPAVSVVYDGPPGGHGSGPVPAHAPGKVPGRGEAEGHGVPTGEQPLAGAFAAASTTVSAASAPDPDEDGGPARINLRVPAGLKSRIDEAAAAEGMSVNAWLIRAATAALTPTETPPRRSAPTSGRARRFGADQYTGWVR